MQQVPWNNNANYCSADYIGQPLLIVPRNVNRAPQYFPLAYTAYPVQLLPFPEFYPASPQSVPLYMGLPHRDSFSSCSSSESPGSSGAPSPVHFANAHSWSDSSITQPCETLYSPPKREWIQKTSEEVPEVQLGVTLRIMSYNILAEQYASKKLYPQCPQYALAWPYRKEKIREEIEGHSPDIICLQEITMGEFYGYFLENLQVQGYSGIFSPKSRAKTMEAKNRQVVDGCSIIYRHDRFELVHQDLLEFSQLAIKSADGSTDMLNRVMTKDNIALCAVLRVVEATEPTYILVVNAHVHWDPECSDVKLIQTMLLMNEVERLVEKTKADLNVKNVPMIFCGDLNSLPNSGVVEFLRDGRVSVSHADFRDLPYRSCLAKLSSQGRMTPEGHFFHPFALASVYEETDMAFTNFTADFKGVIDYIFTSKDKFHTVSVLGPVEQAWLDEYQPTGFPCPQIPSDHLPLVAEVELLM